MERGNRNGRERDNNRSLEATMEREREKGRGKNKGFFLDPLLQSVSQVEEPDVSLFTFRLLVLPASVTSCLF